MQCWLDLNFPRAAWDSISVLQSPVTILSSWLGETLHNKPAVFADTGGPETSAHLMWNAALSLVPVPEIYFLLYSALLNTLSLFLAFTPKSSSFTQVQSFFFPSLSIT